MTTLQQIEQVEIQQILALSPDVTLDTALELHKQKIKLVNQLQNEQNVKQYKNTNPIKNLLKCLKKLTFQN